VLPVLELRSFVVLAFADEVTAEPELLAEYGRRFGADDDATLAILGEGETADDVAAGLAPALAAAGLDGDRSPDLLAVPLAGDPRVEVYLRRRAHAVLSTRHDPRAAPDSFGVASAAELRTRAESVWHEADSEVWHAEPVRPDVVVDRSERGHFYSPVPNTAEIAAARRRSQVWPAQDRIPAGIDWREAEQERLLRDVYARQERLELRTDEGAHDEYFTENGQYPAHDAWILEGLLRHLRPRRMIEVGSGFSSLVSARVNRDYLGGQMRFTCIEPFPREFLRGEVEGITGLVINYVQDVPLDLYEELGDGDVLFIDTSHTVKTGGDVPWLFNEVLPRLRPGVYVHVHDVFFPRDYPQKWVFEGWNWNEQYLLQSFLQFNSAFEVVLGAQWMARRLREAMLEAFPGMAQRRHAELVGASLWLRRV
jgi:predicted O-methyltransferase YrrM